MKESILHKFFLDEVSTVVLAEDLKDSQKRTGFDTYSVSIESIEKGEFQIESKHLIKLCEAHLNKEIEDVDLNTIGFALMASDFFTWDSETKQGKIVGEVIHDWDNESIGYDINSKNVWLWKNYLENGYLNLDKEELKIKYRSKGKFLKLYQNIDYILWKEWDPIGASELARDEYQSYTPKIFNMKKSECTVKELSEHLHKLETLSMGLNGNKENCDRVAKMINELKIATHNNR